MSVVEDIDDIDVSGNSKTSKSKNKTPGDFPSLFAHLLMSLNWKLAMFVFILFIVITSDVFVDKVLQKIPNTTTQGLPNNKGTIVQATMLVILLMLIDACINAEIM